MTSHLTQEQITLRSRQLNPCDHLFWRSRGYAERPDNWEDILEEIGYYASEGTLKKMEVKYTARDTEGSYHEEESEYEEEAEFEEESEYDEEEDSAEEEEDSEDEEYEEHMTISNENNPNNDAFWRLRGYSERPDNWRAPSPIEFYPVPVTPVTEEETMPGPHSGQISAQTPNEPKSILINKNKKQDV